MAVYEVASGSALTQVEGFCRHLTNSGTFDTNSQPTNAWVVDQLNIDSAYIGAKLGECGYDSAQTDADVLQILQAWNTIRTVMAIELSNPVNAVSGRGNARFQEFINREKAIEKTVCGPGLADIGAAVSGGLGEFLVATGVSADRKKTVEDDTDHIKHRIRRGQFKYPKQVDPHADVDDVVN